MEKTKFEETKFESIVTEIGRYKITQSIQLGRKLELSTLAVGDGDGGYYPISDKQTELANQVWAGGLSSVEINADAKDEINVTSYIPTDVGGFYIREAGIFDKDGDLIVIARHPETYKPLSEFGAYKDLTIRIIISISNAANVILNVDPSIVHATQKDIERLREDIPNIVKLDGYQKLEEKGKNGGYTPLGADGKVPAKHLPVPTKGLSLGETQDTAYRGDRGKVAYDHSQSKHAPANAYSKEQSDSNLQAIRNEALKLGATSTTAYRGDHGLLAYDHSRSKHADPNAITKNELTKVLDDKFAYVEQIDGIKKWTFVKQDNLVSATFTAIGSESANPSGTIPVGFRPKSTLQTSVFLQSSSSGITFNRDGTITGKSSMRSGLTFTWEVLK